MNKVDLKKLAAELGLSVSTVSRALRDKHDISIGTKQRVMALAKEWNYQPNPYASNLRKRKSRTIGVVIPEVANNFFALAINGIEAIAQEHGYHVLIYLTHENQQKEKDIVRHLQNGRVDGLLLSLSGETDTLGHIRDLNDSGLPFVFFDRVSEEAGVPTVTTDDYLSGYNATTHLVQQDCKKIAYFALSEHLSISNKRREGYADALRKNGLPYNEKLVLYAKAGHEENIAAFVRLLRGKQRPDGVFASVETLAVAVYEACARLNLRIPEDLKVIGFSNLAVASLLNPSLTTITQPAFDIGKEAASILFKILERKEKNKPETALENKVLKSELVIRDSTRK